MNTRNLNDTRHAILFAEYFNYPRTKENSLKGVLNNLIVPPTNNVPCYKKIGEEDILLGGTLNTFFIKEIERDYPEKNIRVFSITNILSLTGQPSKLKNYQKNAWHHYYLPYQKIEPDVIFPAALAIHQAKKQGELIYMHCDFGQVMGAIILAVYFACYNEKFIEKFSKNETHASSRLSMAIKYVEHHSALKISYLLIEKLLSGQQYQQIIEPASQEDFFIPSAEKVFSAEHFMRQLVQSYPFKELLVFICEKTSNASLASEIEHLKSFLNQLKFFPQQAMTELVTNIQTKINPETPAGQLMLHLKSKEAIGILQRLSISMAYYLQYDVFQPTLAHRLAINPVTLGHHLQKRVHLTDHLKEIFKLSDWCACEKEPELHRVANELNECVTGLLKMTAMLASLDRACNIHRVYQHLIEKNPKGNYLDLCNEALERTGCGMGLLLAHLQRNKKHDFIEGLLKINKMCHAQGIGWDKNVPQNDRGEVEKRNMKM